MRNVLIDNLSNHKEQLKECIKDTHKLIELCLSMCFRTVVSGQWTLFKLVLLFAIIQGNNWSLGLQNYPKKSTPCLIKKASRCAADCMFKITFYLSLSTKHKDLMRKSCVFIYYFIGSVVKIYYIYIFFTERKVDFDRLKRNMNDGKSIYWQLYLLPYSETFCFPCLSDTR